MDGGAFASVGTPANFTAPYTSPRDAVSYRLITDNNSARKGHNTIIVVRAKATDGADLSGTAAAVGRTCRR